MPALTVLKPHEVTLTEQPECRPGPGEVTVRFLKGGLCGSDLAAYLGTSPMIVYPRVLGHELVGEVVAAGDGAAAWLGAVVVVEPLLACGTCIACRQGRYNTCVALRVLGVHVDGGFRDEFVAPASHLHRTPAGMDLDTAVLTEPLTIACQAVFRARVAAGESVLIFGAGPIGLLALQVAVAHLKAKALVVDIRQERLDLAGRLGAAHTVNVAGWSGPGASPALLAAVQAWTGGDMAQVAIEATGHAASTQAAIDCLAHTGRLGLVGWNKQPITVDTVQLMRKELDVYGSRNSCRMFPRALAILAAGHIDVGAMISHRFTLAEGPAALRLMSDPAVDSMKVVLEP